MSGNDLHKIPKQEKLETWGEWIEDNSLKKLIQLNKEQAKRPWEPTKEDKNAAWIIYTEINSRITTQPLHYRAGDEETALTSIFNLFQITRDTIKDQGRKCEHFATIALYTLNTHIRPFTAKWHRKKVDDEFSNDDDRRLFREELKDLQLYLRDYSKLLGLMALGDNYVDISSDKNKEKSSYSAFSSPIPFDCILFSGSKVSNFEEIHSLEQKEIINRRNATDQTRSTNGTPEDLVGLACSGGGIRAATVCLGVSQVLAKQGVLKQVDYLSTVSGGGYFGSFISSYLNSDVMDKHSIGLESDQLPFYEGGVAEPTSLRHLRNNSKYLLKGGLLGKSRIAALFLSGISVNIAALLPVFLILLFVAYVGEHCHIFGNISEFINTTYILVFLFIFFISVSVFTKFSNKWKDILIKSINTMLFLLIVGITAFNVAKLLPLIEAKLSTSSLTDQLLIGLVLLGSIIILFINTNHSTLHRYYRNRLTETYLLNMKNRRTEAKDDTKLSDLSTEKCGAPYHLINCAINLPDSTESELRGRNSDFFIFSPKWSGSQLTGYCKTEDMEKFDKHLDLGTAMSISGAAASAFMGTLSQKPWSYILSLLNIRLGYWIINPKRVNENKKIRVPLVKRPNPYILYKELFGKIDENQKYVNLSDGGHIENLGIYELLRRRCKFIIAIDAEADPKLRFKSLNTLIRYAKIDFDIDIDINLGDFQKNKHDNCKAHFALGTIDYGKGLTGYLLYLKSSLTGNERDYIQDYHKSHPSFPHESTADQFFTEQQFEAYRALGSHMAEDLFRKELDNHKPKLPIHDFFKNLVTHLFI